MVKDLRRSEAGRILREEAKPSREFTFTAEDAGLTLGDLLPQSDQLKRP